MVHDFVKRDYLKVFVLCPVRDATEKEKEFLGDYVEKLENQGYKIHYPPRDTEQVDPLGGYGICSENSRAIMESDEVHVYWNKKSQGSLFYLGTSFNEHKIRGMKIRLANRKDVETIVEEAQKPKIFEQVLLKLDDLAGFKKPKSN